MILLLVDCHLCVLPTMDGHLLKYHCPDTAEMTPLLKTARKTRDGKQRMLLKTVSSSVFQLSHNVVFDLRSFTWRNICCAVMLFEVTAQRITCINYSKGNEDKLSKGPKTSQYSGRWIQLWTSYTISISPYRQWFNARHSIHFSLYTKYSAHTISRFSWTM